MILHNALSLSNVEGIIMILERFFLLHTGRNDAIAESCKQNKPTKELILDGLCSVRKGIQM